MLLAAIEVLPRLPALPSGKTDRRALPAPRARSSAARADFVALRTSLEEHLSATWSSLFGSDRVSIHDDFFLDLGGHSLLAAKAVSQSRRQPELAHLSVLDLYGHPTIALLAAEMERRKTELRTQCDPRLAGLS